MATRENILGTEDDNGKFPALSGAFVQDKSYQLLLKFIKSALIYETDGVKRQGTDLEINPGNLKLFGGDTTSWTIKVENNELKFIPSSQTNPAVTFTANGAFELGTALTFKDKDDCEVKSQIGGQKVTKEGNSRGIPHTGLRGFKSGRVNAADNHWQPICTLPNTFGKYHLEAWSIHDVEYTHYAADIVFAPVEAQRNPDTENWLHKLWFKISPFVSGSRRNVVIRRRIHVRWGPESWNLHNIIKVRPRVNDDGSRELQIMATRGRAVPDGIHYTLDRIWEGENWMP